jgi:hypothetical protein
MTSIEEYLGRIDLVTAVVVALVAGGLALGINRFLQASADEVFGAVPFINGSVANAILRRRRGVPTERWVCTVCRSLNIPTATVCYHGCGKREDVAMVRAHDPAEPPTGEGPGTAGEGPAPTS